MPDFKPQQQQVGAMDDDNEGGARAGEEEENECDICMDREREVAYWPCGHFCTCRQCDKQWEDRSKETGKKQTCSKCLTDIDNKYYI